MGRSALNWCARVRQTGRQAAGETALECGFQRFWKIAMNHS